MYMLIISLCMQKCVKNDEFRRIVYDNVKINTNNWI